MSKEALRKIDTAIAVTDDLAFLATRRTIAAEKDRMVRPNEAVTITGRSLASQWRDRQAGRWPKMYRIGANSVGYLLSDLLALNASREIVTSDNTRPVAPKAKRGRKAKNQGGEGNGK